MCLEKEDQSSMDCQVCDDFLRFQRMQSGTKYADRFDCHKANFLQFAGSVGEDIVKHLQLVRKSGIQGLNQDEIGKDGLKRHGTCRDRMDSGLT